MSVLINLMTRIIVKTEALILMSKLSIISKIMVSSVETSTYKVMVHQLIWQLGV